MTDFIRLSRTVDSVAGACLTLRQLALLQAVVAGANRVRTAAEAIGVGKPVITRAMIQLEQVGLAQRAREPKDRRSVIISLTPAGTSLLTALGLAPVEAQPC